jgi:hypothetical protein
MLSRMDSRSSAPDLGDVSNAIAEPTIMPLKNVKSV